MNGSGVNCSQAYERRFRDFTLALEESGCMPFLVLDLNNIRYCTGFTGSHGALLVDDRGAVFISDSRYEEYARSILPSFCEFLLQKEDLYSAVNSVLGLRGHSRLFLEEERTDLGTFRALDKAIGEMECKAVPCPLYDIRMIKDPVELDLLSKAAEITDRCVDHICDIARPDMTEWELSVEIEYFYRKAGCRSSSFPTIVASGPGSSMPHYETSMRKKIQDREVLLVDMGCVYRGYNSDLTRSFFMGSVDPELGNIYRIVLEAQQNAIRTARPGISTVDLDRSAREVIASAGYGDYFVHSLGHGFGLEVHEKPYVRSRNPVILKENMCITIEPGVYIPGKGGVRIEDMVLVKEEGSITLTHSSKEIKVL